MTARIVRPRDPTLPGFRNKLLFRVIAVQVEIDYPGDPNLQRSLRRYMVEQVVLAARLRRELLAFRPSPPRYLR